MGYPEDRVDKGTGMAGLLQQAGLDHGLLSTLLDAMQDGVLVTDEQGIIRAANRAALALFRYSTAQLLGRPVSLLISLPGPAAQPAQGLLTARNTQREVMARCRDGESRTLRLGIGEFMWQERRMFMLTCHDITEQHRHAERIAFLASHDGLTGCPNREQFLRRLAQALRERGDAGHSLAVLFIDLDGFKAVNDIHGHRVGDLLLKRVAERLRRSLRGLDLLGRLGGDEFVVLAHLDNDPQLAQRIGTRLVASLQQPFSLEGLALRVSASIGISLLDGQQQADELLEEADIAMYQAKLEGGDRVRVFSEALRERTATARRRLTGLREAIARQQLELHYQVQFDMRSLKPAGLGAVLRWRFEDGPVLPEQFMPMAQAHDMAPDIEFWALQQACRDKAVLVTAGLLDARVAVPIGPALLQAPGFAGEVQGLLQEHGLAPRHLELELIEANIMAASLPVRQNLLALTNAGVSLGIGNLGTDPASLTHLKDLPVSTLRFTAGLPDSIDDRALIRALVETAGALDMRTLAEDVQSVAQMACLQGLGCTLGQGGWYAPAMPLAELIPWLEGVG